MSSAETRKRKVKVEEEEEEEQSSAQRHCAEPQVPGISAAAGGGGDVRGSIR